MATIGSEPIPMYREGSPADATLIRAAALARRSQDLVGLAKQRLMGVSLDAPGPGNLEKGALKGEDLPPFFSCLASSLDVIESTLANLESLLDRTAL